MHNVMKAAQENGIRSLYRHAKPPGSNSSSSHVSLQNWFTYYSELYQTFEEPRFLEVNVVPTESAAALSAPFGVNEIERAVGHTTPEEQQRRTERS